MPTSPTGPHARTAFVLALIERVQKAEAVVAAAIKWAGDCEGMPKVPGDAALLKVIAAHEGEGPKRMASLDQWVVDYEGEKARREARDLAVFVRHARNRP